MNKEIVKGRWKEIKGKVKQKWGKLTDDEITQMKGTYEELTGTLQKKYGIKKEQAETELNAFLEENHFDDNL